MTNVIQFTPLYGASDTGPLCYLLELDDCKILLDCGWDDHFNEKDVEALARVISDVDAVLISHPDIAHIGALPYAFGQLGLDCPIFSTQPVWRMGWMFMYDAWQRLNARMDFDLFSIDDVDAAFEKITSVTYSQECRLTGRGDGITVTPFQAGHTLGGAIWRVVKESEQIVYAVDINHRRERHLDGTVLETACPRPSVLITDVYNVLKHVPTRKERDAQLFDAIRECLEGGGNCLMPVHTAGRVLELLVYLHSRWVAARLDQKYTIAFLSHVAFNTIDFARTYLEWMSETCQKQFDQARESPFDLKHLHICQSIEELDRLPQPVLVLASCPFIDASFAEDLFIRWAPDKKNLILLTMAPRVPCIASALLQVPPPPSIEILRRYRTPLQGDELREFEEKRKEQEASVAKEESESESDEDDDADFDERVGATTAIFKRRLKLVPTYPMFGFKEVVHSSDMYGEQIDFSDYAIPDLNPLAESGGANPGGPTGTAAATLAEAVPMPVVPTKALTELITVPIRCQIAFVDFEGRMDQNSIKNVIKRVQPRKTILVHGPDKGKELFMQFMESDLPPSSTAVAPDNLQTSVISAEKNVFNIKLRDSLVKDLRFVKVEDYEVAYVDGRIVQSDESRHPVLEATGSTMYERPAVFLGGPRMADLKKAITSEGIEAEFISGVLVCENGEVNIRKVSDQQVSIQGAIGELYFKIRSIIYSQYTIL